MLKNFEFGWRQLLGHCLGRIDEVKACFSLCLMKLITQHKKEKFGFCSLY